ncbi:MULTISPECIES: glutamine synthetase III [Synechococcus]|jgi:glutamine synthetase|uniref:glutamine synthetase III family protein n=2 Tax=Synechococcus TaxID=1129 RepID=UPI0009C75D2E|nr:MULTISPECIES: glutamine synthetase III [Synechococcus]MCF8135364.1 glutamine synthetase III [Synechococcus lacustris]OON12205.1 MAG: glutamine synthetase type III [Synechococcus lacustris str. Tous]MCP9793872.1 glutamine synthetase III [Synechococcus lacustris L1F-Slac]MCP9814653.1 glutamine synthetase III [Synechococcus lacustris L1E-Slac]MCP9921696.1 glutamine synthetase III [Synechococcus lacustris Cruz CV12-2]
MPSPQRLSAIEQIQLRGSYPAETAKPLDELWAKNVFTLEKMKKALPKEEFKMVQRTIREGGKLDPSVANAVAQAMKEWATSHGALYYAHVFYPLTNSTAEKHDGFIAPQSDGTVISEFTGKLLVQGEPDGSSFPNGGLRSTFEARGYTAWDITSPAYLMETPNGVTLCVPTVFVSWTGEALDKKTPLLRSNAAMNRQAKRLLTLLGNTDVAPVNSSCGAEQEYFLIDQAFLNLRPDLLLVGRSLFGAASAKGQQFDDHYFGAIPERVQVFMQDVEQQLYRLGVPCKTRHNEVAPGQFEIAPVYEAANVATDHQQLIMTLLRSTAKKHGLACLLHEKPFAGINGSGKHVNWSVGNSTQGNLLDPGNTPHENMQFLLFCGAVIRGVHRFGPLMRSVVATAGNDHRLGANEAPPAIISIYLGSQLEDVFNQILQGEPKSSSSAGVMQLGVDTLPEFPKDPGDRNRTSPFAFTGNRFEFRAVGSGQSVAGPLVAMNTILADSLQWLCDELERCIQGGASLQDAAFQVLKQVMQQHGSVVFGGDGYSEEWHHKAVAERGLENLPTCADALLVLERPEIANLFEGQGVLTRVELQSRYEVYAEQYILAIEVEAKLALRMARTQIQPAVQGSLGDMSGSLMEQKSLGLPVDTSLVERISALNREMQEQSALLEQALNSPPHGSAAHMKHCAEVLLPIMLKLRQAADALEVLIDDDRWPLPTYQEMLFIR